MLKAKQILKFFMVLVGAVALSCSDSDLKNHAIQDDSPKKVEVQEEQPAAKPKVSANCQINGCLLSIQDAGAYSKDMIYWLWRAWY